VFCFVACDNGTFWNAAAQIMAQGAVGCLVELADTNDVETRLHSVGALCNLTSTSSSRGQMIEQHAAAALNLSKCVDLEVMRRCAIALVNLSAILPLQSQFIAQGALSGLQQLCIEGSPLIKLLCARALYNLSFNPESHDELVKANVCDACLSCCGVTWLQTDNLSAACPTGTGRLDECVGV
jgi:hypothetical protein